MLLSCSIASSGRDKDGANAVYHAQFTVTKVIQALSSGLQCRLDQRPFANFPSNLPKWLHQRSLGKRIDQLMRNFRSGAPVIHPEKPGHGKPGQQA